MGTLQVIVLTANQKVLIVTEWLSKDTRTLETMCDVRAFSSQCCPTITMLPPGAAEHSLWAHTGAQHSQSSTDSAESWHWALQLLTGHGFCWCCPFSNTATTAPLAVCTKSPPVCTPSPCHLPLSPCFLGCTKLRAPQHHMAANISLRYTRRNKLYEHILNIAEHIALTQSTWRDTLIHRWITQKKFGKPKT